MGEVGGESECREWWGTLLMCSTFVLGTVSCAKASRIPSIAWDCLLLVSSGAFREDLRVGLDLPFGYWMRLMRSERACSCGLEWWRVLWGDWSRCSAGVEELWCISLLTVSAGSGAAGWEGRNVGTELECDSLRCVGAGDGEVRSKLTESISKYPLCTLCTVPRRGSAPLV